jgi:hypothetical protein
MVVLASFPNLVEIDKNREIKMLYE